jgi:hypothetical protein
MSYSSLHALSLLLLLVGGRHPLDAPYKVLSSLKLIERNFNLVAITSLAEISILLGSIIGAATVAITTIKSADAAIGASIL